MTDIKLASQRIESKRVESGLNLEACRKSQEK